MEFDERGQVRLLRPWKSFGLGHPSRLLADIQELRQDFAKRPVGQYAETGCVSSLDALLLNIQAGMKLHTAKLCSFCMSQPRGSKNCNEKAKARRTN